MRCKYLVTTRAQIQIPLYFTLLYSGSTTSLTTYLLCRSERDLQQLSSLGHFLKGSSATLGLTKVKDSCEKIQHFGQKKDEAGTTDEPDEDRCLARIKDTLAAVKEEYAEVERVLRRFYGP